ncbi:hypothetical protein [Actinomadura sp. NEAU-AAG7]|uniref:hypothetical protein n=1 Tax=Actinomadura sp. NEAU-AAG7 TaxID=2839640 RepID=UPI001BE477D3|nr:hypothetical protein [Actinomadura sp. NEAU-AAG7]MBT2211212.1 hypothetical protein [Actinomadura sp. NEAU-AAG7]
MARWRPKREIPDSALMPTYRYAIFMAGFLLAAVALTMMLAASATGTTPGGNIIVYIVLAIGALCGYWLAYLGLKMTMYARRRRGGHSNR